MSDCLLQPSYCSTCAHGWPDVPHSDACNRAVTWLATDLPAMRKAVRQEHPDWDSARVAIEAIRRLG